MSPPLSSSSPHHPGAMPLITCYPPLGQTTKITSDGVFYCVLNIDEADASRKVWLRYAPIGSNDWEQKEMVRSEQRHFQSEQPGITQLSFEGTIHITTATRFEIQCKGSAETWTTTDVESIVLPNIQLGEKSRDLDDYMKNLNPNLQTSFLDHGSQTDVVSWMVKVPVAAANVDVPHMEQVMFGKPFGGKFLRYELIDAVFWDPVH